MKALSENAKLKISSISLSVVFAITAILFFFTQYIFSGESYFMYSHFSGLDLAFGLTIEGGRAGFFPFFLPLLFSVVGIICAVMTAFKKSKSLNKVLFCFCAAVALISAIIYVATYFYETSRYEGVIKFLDWTFAFWGAFAFYCIAFLISSAVVFFAFRKNKPIPNNKNNEV